jgi:hypothetical protein
LILGSCWLKFDLVADSIEKSQCEKLVERRFTVRLDLIQYFQVLKRKEGIGPDSFPTFGLTPDQQA